MTRLLSALATFRLAQAATVGLDTGDAAQSPATSLNAPPAEKHTETHEQYDQGKDNEGKDNGHEGFPPL